MNNSRTCYMCDRVATSDEHAPPKCIFPEQKDLPPGVDYRKNLITVPSCDEHNTQKSKEDEYLLYILPATIGSNAAGLNQFLTKVRRAMTRKPLLAAELAKNPVEVTVHDTEKDIWLRAVGLKIDIGRIQDTLEKTARAIYFHHTKLKQVGAVDVVGNFSLDLQNVSLNARVEALFAMADELLKGEVTYGENPDVFTYRLARSESGTLIDLRFYGLNRALAFLKHG